MSVHLKIPDSVAQAMRVPDAELQQRLLTELALALYARGILSFGKARELVGLGKYEFGLLLGQRAIPRHYTSDELQDDVKYAGRQ
jgi:predicted HTH domain antitoxin